MSLLGVWAIAGPFVGAAIALVVYALMAINRWDKRDEDEE